MNHSFAGVECFEICAHARSRLTRASARGGAPFSANWLDAMVMRFGGMILVHK
jgi:hypothetical protein